MRNLLLGLCTIAALTLGAQTDDPVLMIVDGQEITRSEFEYSFNKNRDVAVDADETTVEDYVEMFLNYKLKVAAAVRAGLDRDSAFIQEFHTYRDMQLTPSLVDSVYIDSVAHALYAQQVRNLGGRDLLHPAHIFLRVPQQATAEQEIVVKQRADSIYQALMDGADFAALAKQYSEDTQTKNNGGQLPWIGPGAAIEDFENAAYQTATGQYSPPVHSSIGYHIIYMEGRKKLEPYEELHDDIVAYLKRQRIEERSAEAKIQKLIAASGGTKTREDIIREVLEQHEAENPDLRHLVQEYHDGILFYNVSKQTVWDKVEKDDAALDAYFKAHKDAYRWEMPRFKGYVFHTKDEKLLKKVKKTLSKCEGSEYRRLIKQEYNSDSTMVFVQGPYLCKQGENAFIDKLVFGTGSGKTVPKFPYSGVSGKKLKQPKTYADVRAQVVQDVQREREAEWVEELRAAIPYSIDQTVLTTVNNHN